MRKVVLSFIVKNESQNYNLMHMVNNQRYVFYIGIKSVLDCQYLSHGKEFLHYRLKEASGQLQSYLDSIYISVTHWESCLSNRIPSTERDLSYSFCYTVQSSININFFFNFVNTETYNRIILETKEWNNIKVKKM